MMLFVLIALEIYVLLTFITLWVNSADNKFVLELKNNINNYNNNKKKIFQYVVCFLSRLLNVNIGGESTKKKAMFLFHI